jgi:hypothetical protein
MELLTQNSEENAIRKAVLTNGHSLSALAAYSNINEAERNYGQTRSYQSQVNLRDSFNSTEQDKKKWL